MAMLEVSVSRYSLSVDVRDTLAVMLWSADTPWGRRLQDALGIAMCRVDAIAVSPFENVTDGALRPDTFRRVDALNVKDFDVSGVLAKLASAGYVSTHRVWSEQASESYLSDGRHVTAVRVLKPFVVLAVDYTFSPAAERRLIEQGSATTDRWHITERSRIVPAGWYLVGETGDYRTDMFAVAGISALPDDDRCWLAELEGFSVSTCLAGCDTCDSRWTAESGSWHFRADECDAEPWHFDDADDIDERSSTIACPACDTGRVGFTIH